MKTFTCLLYTSHRRFKRTAPETGAWLHDRRRKRAQNDPHCVKRYGNQAPVSAGGPVSYTHLDASQRQGCGREF